MAFQPRTSIFWFLAASILLLSLVLRLAWIDELEPFVDEGANALTSLDANVRREFDPIAQGRPLLAWMFRPADWMLFSTLTNARVLVALTGTCTVALVGVGLGLSSGRRSALLGMVLWATLPIAVFHERLVLQDPAIAALLAAVFVLFVLFARTIQPAIRSALALGAGFLFGTALLVKLSALLALPWLCLALLAVQRQSRRPILDRRYWLILCGALLPFLLLGSDLARLGARLTQLRSVPRYLPDDSMLTQISRVAIEATDRMPLLISWYCGYGGLALIILFLGAALALMISPALGRWLALGWALSFLGATLIYRLPYARYLLPDHLPLVLFIAVALGTLTKRRQIVAAFALIAFSVVMWLRIDLQIVRNPAMAQIPKVDIEQYITGLWSGNGVRRLETFLADHTRKHQQQCLVITHAYYRPGCYGLMFAARHNPTLGVVPLYYRLEGLERIDAVVARATQVFGREPAVFVLIESTYPKLVATLVASGADEIPALDFVRHDGESRFTLYRYRTKP